MIYTNEKNRYINYRSPLMDYIKSTYFYTNENLIYTTKYTTGSFSITNPTKSFSNCTFVNGYPHFNIPIEICLDEIEFFLSNKSLYDNNFYIRYGDTHPHKCIPKLAQIRNLLIENSLSSMIGQNANSYYGLGDISIKSLNDFKSKNNLSTNVDDLFKQIVKNNISGTISEDFKQYSTKAIKEIETFLKVMGLKRKQFLIESNLYQNQQLYNSIKCDPLFFQELKSNGEFKYSLQEVMFIRHLLRNDNDILINIIGSNQSEHVIKVNELINSNYKLRNRFLTYQICKNADERNISIWSEDLIDFIHKNNIKIKNKYISYQQLLKILVIITSNDTILDFHGLDKTSIFSFINAISNIEDLRNEYNIVSTNDLINKMALVCYNLNRSIEMGNQNYFYKYFLSIIKEFHSNKDKYYCMEGLYKKFIMRCMDKLGFPYNEIINL